MDFNKMKVNSKKSLSTLTDKLEKMDTKSSYVDDRFWKPTRDKSGNSYSIIRFLPPAPEDSLNFAKIYNHAFDVNGKWFIDNCPTSIGKVCPVCESNSELWNSGLETNKSIARNRKRKLSYIVNIFVISDKQEPENEGKVFLYKIGPQIFEKISNAIKPKFEDDEKFNPFDLWTGANFKLKIKKTIVDGKSMSTYEDSVFETPAPLFDNDAVLEEIWNKEYKLEEFVSEPNFKEYDELKKRFDFVVGSFATTPKVKTVTPKETDDDLPFDVSDDDSADILNSSNETNDTEFDDSDDMSYFAALADED